MRSVSVIVATCNRPQDLRECLAAILANSYPVGEVLIMDQSGGWESRETADMFEDARLRYFHLDVRGKSQALNVALHAALGDILCFTDDDCLPTLKWVQAFVDEFDADQDVCVVFGQTPPMLPPSRTTADVTVYATYVSPSRRVFVKRRKPYDVGGGGGNMAYRREAMAKIGDFDEALGPGAPFKAVEDNEYFYRTFKLGMKGVYCPQAIAYHKQDLDKQAAAQRLREYRLGDGAFIAKYLLKLDPVPLVFYLMGDARQARKALAARDFPYLKHVVKRFRFTMGGLAAYMRWRLNGTIPTDRRRELRGEPGAY